MPTAVASDSRVPELHIHGHLATPHLRGFMGALSPRLPPVITPFLGSAISFGSSV